MKNGIEIRPNGNRIMKDDIFGYNVHILRENGGYRSSDNGPWDFLRNAREDADNQTPIHIVTESLCSNLPVREDISDSIRNISRATYVLNTKLKETYLPFMRECKTSEELSILINDIRMSLGMKCGEEFPGAFGIEIIFEFQRFHKED